MMYCLTMSVDGSMESFNISNTMVDGIIEDINAYKEKCIVLKSDKDISIFKENKQTTYFYNKEDRNKKAMEFLSVH